MDLLDPHVDGPPLSKRYELRTPTQQSCCSLFGHLAAWHWNHWNESFKAGLQTKHCGPILRHLLRICFHHLKNRAVSFNKKYKNKKWSKMNRVSIILNIYQYIIYIYHHLFHIVSCDSHGHMLSIRIACRIRSISAITGRLPEPSLGSLRGSLRRWSDGPKWTDWTAPAGCQKGFPAQISVLSSTISFTGLVNIWNLIYEYIYIWYKKIIEHINMWLDLTHLTPKWYIQLN